MKVDRSNSLLAKPGFGKTVLSSAIIENLSSKSGHVIAAEDERPAVAYFHFDKSTRHGGKTSNEAFRALAAQLIDSHQNEAALVDALSVLFDEKSNQLQASASDVDSVLKLLMQQCPTYLVLDGIDECVDYRELLVRMSDLLMTFDCRVLMLSRPDVTFPWSYRVKSNSSWLAQLNTSDNMAGVGPFLHRRLGLMADQALFGNHEIDPDLIDDLTTRSQGVFLWAIVLTKYLECPALSPNERIHTMKTANLLQDMAQLYNRILETLAKSYENKKQVAIDIFRWTAFSLYPLGVTELRIAVAIVPGESTDQADLLADLPNCVQQISCSLVEIDHYRFISFIHLSFKEFIERDPQCHPRFTLRDTQAVHRALATSCISHLLRDIPEQPLRRLETDVPLETGNVGNFACGAEARLEHRLQPAESRSRITAKYPFLRYAFLCWTTHMVRALPLLDKGSSVVDFEATGHQSSQRLPPWQLPYRPRKRRRLSQDFGSSGDVELSTYASRYARFAPLGHTESSNYFDHSDEEFGSTSILNAQRPENKINLATLYRSAADCTEDWAPFLSELLIRPMLVNVWVEMCCTFGSSPNLTHLSQQLKQLSSKFTQQTVEGREMWWISSGVHRLSHALLELRDKHHLHLVRNPTMIWQDHICSATDPVFWSNWETEIDDELTKGAAGVTVRAGMDPRFDGPSVGAESASLFWANFL